jgi:hypothetical protein
MSNTQLYFAIIKTETHHEYHVSANKQLVKNHKALSRRVPLCSPIAAQCLEDWKIEAEFYGSIDVE